MTDRKMLENLLPALQALLGRLGHDPKHVDEARQAIEALVARFSDLKLALVVDRPPAAMLVEYDVLVSLEDGTLALSWRADHGQPWTIDYANHWASDAVLTVDNNKLTISDALLALRQAEKAYSGLDRELVNRVLIERAMERMKPEVNEEEVQAAADRFRATLGLFTAQATERWLSETGFSIERLTAIATSAAKRDKMRQTLTEPKLLTYFPDHQDDFERFSFWQVETTNEAVAKRLLLESDDLGSSAKDAVVSENLPISAMLVHSFAYEHPDLKRAALGAKIGPIRVAGRFRLEQLLSRRPPTLDESTRERIREVLFAAWLDEERRRSKIAWVR